uniref:Uncharacterized protein n=1 Tax=Romanomermis culicivorax TaxID=13658 RepID=A0A915JJ32_ROMCU
MLHKLMIKRLKSSIICGFLLVSNVNSKRLFDGPHDKAIGNTLADGCCHWSNDVDKTEAFCSDDGISIKMRLSLRAFLTALINVSICVAEQKFLETSSSLALTIN